MEVPIRKNIDKRGWQEQERTPHDFHGVLRKKQQTHRDWRKRD
jgi:hypothetical protein